ncbi:inositol monophosphatase family protein [Paucilactobacillus suebicus]|nr:inositol monophosphatase family protein [Paucilactobacillus suebicus]
MMELNKIDHEIQRILNVTRLSTLDEMKNDFTVEEKSGRKDLVTAIDKSNEKMLVSVIRQLDPEARILGEEGFGDQIDDMHGHVWFVDPIDGTMNFVMQKNRFAIMIALYVDGKPQLGYILDVMQNILYHGGPEMGVYARSAGMVDRRIKRPDNVSLDNSLIGISGPLLINDDYNMKKIAQTSRGPRMYGSAGLEFASVIKGELSGYVSYLKPWDFAAGNVLANELGLAVKTIDGAPLDMLSSNVVLVATEQASEEVIKLAN